MPDQDPAPPYGQPIPAQDAAAATAELPYEPMSAHDEWMAEDEELPRRPRRRLLTPLPLALLAILLVACGFIGGVLIEKGETSSGSAAATGSGLAARFAALRGASSGGSSTAAGAAGGLSRAGASTGFTRPTSGTVAYLAGSTLYVTNSEGNTVKVETSAGTTVSKSVSATVRAIHPGETVTVTGSKGTNGSVSAESISVGSSGGSGLAALFGAGGSSSTSSSSSTSTTGAGGAASLFGG
jgi:hypothetical protein